jgi:hypothetical protein
VAVGFGVSAFGVGLATVGCGVAARAVGAGVFLGGVGCSVLHALTPHAMAPASAKRKAMRFMIDLQAIAS